LKINLTASRALLLFVIIVLLCSVIVGSIVSEYFKHRSVQKLAEDSARQTSLIIFESLYSVMERGWDQNDINEVMSRLRKVLPKTDISLLRGERVAEQFGKGSQQIDEHLNDQLINKVLRSGEAKLSEQEGSLRFIYPIIAEQKCLSCHTNSKLGDVNGMIDIRFPIKDLRVPLEFMLESIFWVFVIIFIIATIIAFIIMNRWLIIPIKNLAHHMREIDALDEMTEEAQHSHWVISEIRTLTEEFHYLLHKLGVVQKKLQERSERDPLTGLYNRRHLDEELNKELARCRRYDRSLGLIMIDLNHFKPINDQYGHEAGDQVLLAVSQAMSKQLRHSDLIARVGGDEFMIIATESNQTAVQSLTEKIAMVVHSTWVDFQGDSLSVTASIGFAIYPKDGDNAEMLQRQADKAMYKDKQLWHAQLSSN